MMRPPKLKKIAANRLEFKKVLQSSGENGNANDLVLGEKDRLIIHSMNESSGIINIPLCVVKNFLSELIIIFGIRHQSRQPGLGFHLPPPRAAGASIRGRQMKRPARNPLVLHQRIGYQRDWRVC
jgi:hypothetical protein